jgi:hypothetical protein
VTRRVSGPFLPLFRSLGLKAGTVYPILIRLAERGQVDTEWEQDVTPVDRAGTFIGCHGRGLRPSQSCVGRAGLPIVRRSGRELPLWEGQWSDSSARYVAPLPWASDSCQPRSGSRSPPPAASLLGARSQVSRPSAAPPAFAFVLSLSLRRGSRGRFVPG